MSFKKTAGALIAFAAVLAVLAFTGCPSPVEDPSYGDLSGGAQRNPSETVPPENPDIVIYGVKVGNFIATEGVPGFTIGDAAPGTFFLGEDVAPEDAKDLKITLERVEGYTFDVKYASAAPGVTPGVNDWIDFSSDTDNILPGVISSGDYLIFQIIDATTGEISYYRYAITYGRNGTGIESITIAGRTFAITGTPGIGDDPTAPTVAPVSNTNIYLTSAQIVAGRPIEVRLRQDSARALVSWAPSWVANNGNMPATTFRETPLTTALANNNAIFIRVTSMYGDTYANYKLLVITANNAAVTSFTAGGATVTSTGTPRGSWNAEGLVNASDLTVKSTRRIGAIASAIATNGGMLEWAVVPNLETEPEFSALSEPLDLVYDGYVYVRAFFNNQFMNIYRFPVTEKELSGDATLASITISGTVVDKGTPAATWNGATAGTTAELWSYQIRPPVVTVSPTDSDADLGLQYARAVGSGEPAFSSTAPNLDSGDSLLIKVTSENGANTQFYRINVTRKQSDDANARSVTIADIPATIGAPGTSPAVAGEGSANIYAGGGGPAAPTIVVARELSATVAYAKTSTGSDTPTFTAATPTALAVGNYIWIRIISEDGSKTNYYKFRVAETNTTKYYGRGVPDPEWVAAHSNQVYPNLAANELLSFEKMPDPSYWNARGHMHEYPDLFHFANGNAVVDLADWANRRKELQIIIGYYVRGLIPPIDADTIDISFDPTIETGASPITVTHRASGRTQTVNVNFTISAALRVETNRGKLTGGSISSGSAHHVSGSITDISRTNVMTLYGIPASAGYAPSRDSAGGWTYAIIETAIEGVDLNGDGYIDPATERLYAGWLDPKKALSTTGASTGGKQAAGRGVMGMSRMGTTAGFTNPATAGSLGTALERWITPAGYRVDRPVSVGGQQLVNPNAANTGSTGPGYGWPADPIPVSGSGVGSRSNDLFSAPWYMKRIVAGDPLLGENVPSYKAVSGQDNRRARAVRGWSPYFEDFDNVPQNNAGFSDTNKATNITQPYTAFRTTGYSDNYSGIQTWMQARVEDSSFNWTTNNLRQFVDLHSGLSVDYALNQTTRNPLEQQAGIACTVPADLHFELALAAPNILFMDDGFITPRCNPQAQWAMWIILDEVYKFLGEQEGDGQLDSRYPGSGLYNGWDKYIWRNAIWMNWATHGQGTTEKGTAGAGHAALFQAVIEGNDTTAYAMTESNISKFRDSPWQPDDPVTRFDFYRMDWGRPRPGGKIAGKTADAPTIAERVSRRVEPILDDYYKGEMYHDKPAVALTAATYHDAARQAITSGALVLAGPKFKPMDWRGLTDSPENQ